MQDTHNKLIKEFLKEKEIFAKTYQETINWINEFYHNSKLDSIKNKCFELKKLAKNKKDLLDVPKYTIELSAQLKELNNEIYYTAHTLLQALKNHTAIEIYHDAKEKKRKDEIGKQYEQDKFFLENLCIKFDEKYYMNSLYNLAKYFVKHWVLLLTLCNVIGALILMKYFIIDIHYTPIITQDNMLYLMAVTGVIGITCTIFIGSIFTFFIFYIKKIQENSKHYWSNKQILTFIALIETPLLLIIFVSLGDVFDIFPQWILVVLCVSLLIAFFVVAIFVIKNHKDKYSSLLYMFFLVVCNFIVYILLILSLIEPTDTWEDLMLLTALFFIYNFFFIFLPLKLNFSIINSPFIMTTFIATLLIILMLFSSNIISLLKLGNYNLSSISLKSDTPSNYQKNCYFILSKNEIILKNVHILSNRGEEILLACKSNPVLAKESDLFSKISNIPSNAKNLTLNSIHTINIPSICQTKNKINEKVQLTNIRILHKRDNDLVFECISPQFNIKSSDVNNSVY
ncbi:MULTISPECIES: Yip1 family protein [Helicobacter]|uniref:Integral membrane protein n=1 Tax=Helicobacter ibis TaxID=2962633 RepID=A0ABT4VEY6_9HELI|nr:MULTISPECIES: hypothetical protein [Helicobacter]MDA3967237.1 hypothetical protein [Helicobacter sp. WB40]MDA3968695.1 hypothetical protein [Helicobacter ibis]